MVAMKYVVEYWNEAQAQWLPFKGPFPTAREAERAAETCRAKTLVLSESESKWVW